MPDGLQVEGLSVRYGSAPALNDVAIEVPRGRIVALLGPSGSGKSTLLRAIAGLEPITEGTVTFDGLDVGTLPVHRRHFALMFQDGQLFEHRTVARNVDYGLRLRRQRRGVRAQRVEELLRLVGLEDFADRLPRTLSGGQRQRVALARVLAVDPRLVLLDEPLSSLDRGHREELAAQLREILTVSNAATVLVTHDHEEAFAIADDLVVLRDGRVVQSGPISEVWRHPANPWVAHFLGYPTVLTDEAARRLIAALPPGVGEGWQAVALRRSALRVTTDPSDGTLTGRVRSTRLATDVLRLVVDIAGIGEVPAVASASTQVHVGASVNLRPVPGRLAGLTHAASSRAGEEIG